MKKILGKIGFIFEIIIIAILFVVSIFSIIGSKNDGVASDPIFGISMLPVQSESMVGDKEDSFNKGDLVISKDIVKFEKKDKLEVGDIITYTTNMGNVKLITHRIIRIDDAGCIYALGDNAAYDTTEGQGEFISHERIKCVYITHVAKLGGFFDFFKDKTNYALFIVLPLVILFAWNIYSFVKMFVDYNRQKQIEVAVNGGEVSEELKEIALREYLAKQAKEAAENAANKQENSQPKEEKKD